MTRRDANLADGLFPLFFVGVSLRAIPGGRGIAAPQPESWDSSPYPLPWHRLPADGRCRACLRMGAAPHRQDADATLLFGLFSLFVGVSLRAIPGEGVASPPLKRRAGTALPTFFRGIGFQYSASDIRYPPSLASSSYKTGARRRSRSGTAPHKESLLVLLGLFLGLLCRLSFRPVHSFLFRSRCRLLLSRGKQAQLL